MAGRPRKPTHLKVVAGTDQPCRTNKKEPKPSRKRPRQPTHLSPKAKTAWGAVSLILDRMGVLTEADGPALEGLCGAYADLIAARQSLSLPLILRVKDKEGAVAEEIMASGGERYYWTIGKSGPMRRQRPEIADIADADRRFGAWLAKFGLTPADRSRVSSNDPDNPDKDPWDGF